MATLYNAVSRNGDNKTEKLLLTFSDLVYIHDAGGYDLANDCIDADATNMPNFTHHNKYSYIYTGSHNYLSTTTNIASDDPYVTIENNTSNKKITRLRRTLPYVKDLSTFDNGTNQMFYFKDKYYTPYVIHIGLEPHSNCISSQYQAYYPNNRSAYWTGSSYTYTYLPNISLYSDMYCGLFKATDSANDPTNDLTQYSPASHIIGNAKSTSPFSYAYYLGSYFYRYVWRGREENDANINTHYSDPLQQCVRPDWNIFSRNPAVIRLNNGLANGINIASAISYIDLVVEFNANYVNNILGTNLNKYVIARHTNDTYGDASGVANKFYFRFGRYTSNTTFGERYWGSTDDMDWGIYNTQSHAVESAVHNTNAFDFGKDDSNISILTRFADLLNYNCTTYFNNLGNDFIDANQYVSNTKLVIKSDYSPNFNATIKALHIHVVNNTSYINSYNSCSIIENQYQYWYARICTAFRKNMINIYVNNGLINQDTPWGWDSSLAAKNACTPIHIYSGPINENGGNKPMYGEDGESSNRKYMYFNGNAIIEDCIPLDYLQSSVTSSVTQYIDTGILPNKNTHIYIEFTPTTIPSQDPTDQNSYNVYFCGAAMRNNVRWNIGFNKVGGNSKIFAQYNGNKDEIPITLITGTKYWAELYNANDFITLKCGTDGSTFGEIQISPADDVSTTLTRTIRLFGSNASSNASTNNLISKWSGKIHCCKIWNGDKTDANLLMDLIPVSYNDTYTKCMYDRISKRLLYNNGTGSFTGGNF
jgi:hypothetical protein